MTAILPEFDRVFDRRTRVEMDRHPGTVVGLNHELSIAYLNPAWFRFARDNDGEPAISTEWGLGRPLMEAVPEVLQPLYLPLFRSMLIGEISNQHPRQIEYECSSPELYRRFAMHLYPLASGAGVLLVHSLLVETAHEEAKPGIRMLEPAVYTNAHGLLNQCANCRRFENLETGEWDWIAQWVEQQPRNISHGICPVCLAYYYPDISENISKRN